MIKKIFNLILVLVFILAINSPASAVAPWANPKPSDYDYGITMQEALNQKDKVIFANFYVDWCGYCKKFAPILDFLRKKNKDKYIFIMLNCEDPKNKKYVEDYYISGYPTVYLINPRNENRSLMPNMLLSSPNLLQKEINRFYNTNGFKE